MPSSRHRRHAQLLGGCLVAGWLASSPAALSDFAREEVVVEAEAPGVRESSNAAFARVHYDRWASGRECLIRFGGEGSCTYTLPVPRPGAWHVWLRYASRSAVSIDAGPKGAPPLTVTVPPTGALEGRGAWGWARLHSAELDAGELVFVIHAAPLRPDCLVLTAGEAPPTHATPPAPPAHSAETLAAIAVELTPDRPNWLDEVSGLRAPAWYDRVRAGVHTRLSPRWRERATFRTAARSVRGLGALVLVRHLRTLGEGAWWPSAVGPVEPWAADEDVARGIIGRAHAAGLRLIAYYRHTEDTGVAAQHPDWAARDDSGRIYTRNRRPLMCLNSPYVEHVQARLLELVERGADGLYFDEVHMPPTGCWCGSCRTRFTAATGLPHPETIDDRDPLYRKLLEFNDVTIERAFLRWRRAIRARREDVVLLIGNHRAPDLLDSHTSGRLPRLADGVKTEFDKGLSARTDSLLARTGFAAPPRDVRLALGWSWCRDAAEGRPPHVWIPRLASSGAALAATAGVIAHGGVANLDHPEATIPDQKTFRAALELGARSGSALAGLRPTRRIALHHPERALARLAPDDAAAWREVVGPLVGAFEALMRSRLPVGLVSDNLLAEGALEGYEVLFLPSSSDLSAAMRAAVARFARDGGLVICNRVEWDWCASDGRPRAVRAFLDALGPDRRRGAIEVEGGPAALHVVPYGEGSRRVLALANEFDWVDTRGTRSASAPPDPVEGVRVLAPRGARARDLLSGALLEGRGVGGGVSFDLAPFEHLALVEIELP
ncbi:MAG: hypothetical protein QF410_05945 [Planctomycetota bacterium]|jgi:hypothetical protein|nr:hypothetical protein [Planctomycetota bacterium]MDP6761464.1 hypothetical protein [Planctomycetota bacterium]